MSETRSVVRSCATKVGFLLAAGTVACALLSNYDFQATKQIIKQPAKEYLIGLAGNDTACLRRIRALDIDGLSAEELSQIPEIFELIQTMERGDPCIEPTPLPYNLSLLEDSIYFDNVYQAQRYIASLSLSDLGIDWMSSNNQSYQVYQLPQAYRNDPLVLNRLGSYQANANGDQLSIGTIAVFPKVVESQRYEIGLVDREYQGETLVNSTIMLKYNPSVRSISQVVASDKIDTNIGEALLNGEIWNGKPYLCLDSNGRLVIERYSTNNPDSLLQYNYAIASLWDFTPLPGEWYFDPYLDALSHHDLTRPQGTGATYTGSPTLLFRSKGSGEIAEPVIVLPHLAYQNFVLFREILMCTPYSDGSIPDAEQIVIGYDIGDLGRDFSMYGTLLDPDSPLQEPHYRPEQIYLNFLP